MLGVSGFWATLDAGGGDPGNSDRMTRHGKPRRKPANFNCQPAASRRRIRSLTFASCMIPARTNVPRGRPTSECEIWSRIRYETRYKFTERSYDQDDGCPAVRFSPSGNARDVSANSQAHRSGGCGARHKSFCEYRGRSNDGHDLARQGAGLADQRRQGPGVSRSALCRSARGAVAVEGA